MKVGISLPQLGPQASPENLIRVQVVNQSPGDGRAPMTGTGDEVREDTQRLRDMGITHLIQSPAAIGFDPRAGIDDMLVVMERLIEVSK